jgi:hypothetical protein
MSELDQPFAGRLSRATYEMWNTARIHQVWQLSFIQDEGSIFFDIYYDKTSRTCFISGPTMSTLYYLPDPNKSLTYNDLFELIDIGYIARDEIQYIDAYGEPQSITLDEIIHRKISDKRTWVLQVNVNVNGEGAYKYMYL